jgi:hypothetical protein
VLIFERGEQKNKKSLSVRSRWINTIQFPTKAFTHLYTSATLNRNVKKQLKSHYHNTNKHVDNNNHVMHSLWQILPRNKQTTLRLWPILQPLHQNHIILAFPFLNGSITIGEYESTYARSSFEVYFRSGGGACRGGIG